MTTTPPPPATELAERLQAPEGVLLHTELSERLGNLETTLSARISRGIPHHEYDTVHAALDAVCAARKIMDSHSPKPQDIAESASSLFSTLASRGHSR